MNYKKLRNNMIDQIKEAQMKLGYVKETVRLYYPLSSLCNLLEMEVPTAPKEISGEKALSVAQMDFTDNLKLLYSGKRMWRCGFRRKEWSMCIILWKSLHF